MKNREKAHRQNHVTMLLTCRLQPEVICNLLQTFYRNTQQLILFYGNVLSKVIHEKQPGRFEVNLMDPESRPRVFFFLSFTSPDFGLEWIQVQNTE